jgi:hypothetical protein
VARIVLPPDKTARILGIPIREAEVHAAVASIADDLIRKPAEGADVLVAHELALAYGRPDIVAASVQLGQFRKWRDKRVTPCTAPIALATALALSKLGGEATLDDLSRRTDDAAARARIRRSAATLVDLGWVRRRGVTLVLRLGPGSALRTASGVEAKLNNWRRAVRQVQSWEPYVDAAWLAFPASYLTHVPRTAPLRRFGLISVDDGATSIIRRPSGRRASGVRHLLMEQHLYARWLGVTRRHPRAPSPPPT